MKKPKNIWIIIFIIIIINVLMYLIKPGGEKVLQFTSDLLPVLCAFISVIYLTMAVRSFKEFDYTKIAWLLFLFGTILDFIAESIYGYMEIALHVDMNEYFPGIADYLWCLGYIPFFIGLVMIFIGYKKSGLPMGKTSRYIALSILAFLLLTVIIYFLLVPVIIDPETNLIAKVFYLYYPIADTLVVIPAAILIYITSLFGAAKITRPWKLLAFGFISFTIADLLYSYLGWQDLYGNGNLIDVAWHAGYLFIAMAGLYQYQLVKSLKIS
jgi:hypothetical protein